MRERGKPTHQHPNPTLRRRPSAAWLAAAQPRPGRRRRPVAAWPAAAAGPVRARLPDPRGEGGREREERKS